VLLAPFPPGLCGPVLVASLAAQPCEHAEQVPVGLVPAAPLRSRISTSRSRSPGGSCSSLASISFA
jgi:hypothetical protein